jgi:hypothetical protein
MTTNLSNQVLGFTDLGDLSLFDRQVFEDHFLGMGWYLMCDFEDPANFTPEEAGQAAMVSIAPMMKSLRERLDADDKDGLAAAVAWKEWVLALIERSKECSFV